MIMTQLDVREESASTEVYGWGGWCGVADTNYLYPARCGWINIKSELLSQLLTFLVAVGN